MNLSDRTIRVQIMSAIDASGIKTPKALTTALGEVDRLTSAARSIMTPRGSLAEAFAAAVDAGRDPATDADVQRVMAAQQLGGQGITQDVDAIASERLRAAFMRHSDEIVTSWQKAFTQAAQDLSAGHVRIGNVPLSDTDRIMRGGGDIADVWAKANTANAKLEAIDSGWCALAGFIGHSVHPRRHALLRLASVDADVWVTQGLAETKHSPWDALCMGLDLSLPTFAEYDQRLRAVTARAQQEATFIDTERSAVAKREIRVPIRVTR